MQQQINVLHIEDDQVDRMILAKAFQKHQYQHTLVAASTAQEGIDALRGNEQKQALKGPTIVLLDLSLPGMTGLEFLSLRQQTADLQRCLVIVLTTSDRPTEIQQAYSLGAAGFINKDAAGEGFEQVCQLIETLCQTYILPK
jgi:CheY-like chemotaxis protein